LPEGDALQQRLAVSASAAALACPALAGKTVAPHVLRHTAAMRYWDRRVRRAERRLRCVAHD